MNTLLIIFVLYFPFPYSEIETELQQNKQELSVFLDAIAFVETGPDLDPNLVIGHRHFEKTYGKYQVTKRQWKLAAEISPRHKSLGFLTCVQNEHLCVDIVVLYFMKLYEEGNLSTDKDNWKFLCDDFYDSNNDPTDMESYWKWLKIDRYLDSLVLLV